jgi:hypothetical protein
VAPLSTSRFGRCYATYGPARRSARLQRPSFRSIARGACTGASRGYLRMSSQLFKDVADAAVEGRDVAQHDSKT